MSNNTCEQAKTAVGENVDVIDGGTRTIDYADNRPMAIRFGTVGHGLDLPREVWLEGAVHVFSAQTVDCDDALPGRPAPQKELGPAARLKPNFLEEH